MYHGKICVALVGVGWAGVMHARAFNHWDESRPDKKWQLVLSSENVGPFPHIGTDQVLPL